MHGIKKKHMNTYKCHLNDFFHFGDTESASYITTSISMLLTGLALKTSLKAEIIMINITPLLSFWFRFAIIPSD